MNGPHREARHVAFEIHQAVDLTRRADEQRRDPQERLADAVTAQETYLAGLLGLAPGTGVGWRWTGDGRGRVRCVVVGSVVGAGPALDTAAEQLARAIAAVPDHVVGAPVPAGEVPGVLVPFTPAADGVAQVHKTVRAAAPARPDAGVGAYVTVEPFSRHRAPWTVVLEALRRSPVPVALAVDLAPCDVDGHVREVLGREAHRLLVMGQAGDRPLDLGGREHLDPDAAAVAMLPTLQDQQRRYAGRAFRAAVTVLSEGSLDPGLLQTVAATLSPVPAGADEHRANAVAHRAVVRRPRTEAEARDAVLGWSRVTPRPWPDAELQELLERDRWTRGVVRDGLAELRALVDVGEAASLVRLPVAVDGHLPGFPVVAPADPVRPTPAVRGPSVLLGRQGEDDGAEVRLPLDALPRHAFVVGTPGSGKTNSTLHLCRQLWERKLPFTVFEPVNAELDDYRWLATLPGFDELVVLTVGDESVAPLRLNPFEVPDGVTVAAHVSGLLACFEAAFGLWDPLPFIYRRAMTRTYAARGQHAGLRGSPALRGRWPMLQDFCVQLAVVVEELGYRGDIGHNIDAASRLRAESLVEGVCGPTLDCRTSIDPAVLLGRPVVVELAAVGGDAKEQALITLLLMSTLRAHYRAHRRDGSPQHAMIIEEAHRIFPRAARGDDGGERADPRGLAAERIAQGLAEDRKYGESYVFVDQQVDKVAADAYKITNLKVLHRTSSAEDRRLLGETMSMHEDQVEAAASLAPFRAVVSHNGLDRAVTVTVPDVRGLDAEARGLPEAPLADDAELRRRHDELRAAVPAVEEAMAPYTECRGCRSRCRFRTQAASVAAVDPVGFGELKLAGASAADAAGAVRAVAARNPLGEDDATSPAAEVDYATCLFLHLYRRRFPPKGWSPRQPERAAQWCDAVRTALEASR
ncbi:hypothetical protein ACQPX6_24995 [Actinomycetospora sp. CA-101289]|uniref:ATP-binding protein n=1 Tax=Actinomycetospora sp. CA-101289 TaxID=3239893 RepID=UPI003D99308E